jgi:FeS assembly SUF system regulator
MAQLASSAPEKTSQNARELAETCDLPVPMASKILKALAREGLLLSQRGSKGGYSLAKAPNELTVSEMIRVLEGPVALTDCAIGPARCEHETLCAVREPWQVISRVVEQALADVTLADLVGGRSDTSGRQPSSMLQIERMSDHDGTNSRASS